MLCLPQTLEAKTTYVAHQGVVEDVAWHQHHTDIFGSVGDDKQLILWDTRKPPRDGEQRGMRGPAMARPNVPHVQQAVLPSSASSLHRV